MIAITTACPEQIAAMVEMLPEFQFKNSAEDIASRITGKANTAVIARLDEADAGFMVCYEEDDGVYYNWIMGVLPPFRRAGIGKALITHFAESALLLNRPRLRVKTMNKYRSMLRLLIDTNFHIIAVQDDKITFESDAERRAAGACCKR